MASGLEIAGLTLAAFPLFAQSIDQYRKVAKSITEFLEFKRTFKRLQHQIHVQYTLYRSHLRRFFYEAQIEGSDKLLNNGINPSRTKWEEAQFEVRARALLGDVYPAYIDTISLMLERLDELQRKITWDDAGEAALSNPHDLSSYQLTSMRESMSKHWERLKIMYGRTLLNDLLQDISHYNRDLDKMLGDALEGRRLRSAAKKDSIIARLRRDYQLLHGFLAKVWSSSSIVNAKILISPHLQPTSLRSGGEDHYQFALWISGADSIYHRIVLKMLRDPCLLRPGREQNTAHGELEVPSSDVDDWFLEPHKICESRLSRSLVAVADADEDTNSDVLKFEFWHSGCPEPINDESAQLLSERLQMMCASEDRVQGHISTSKARLAIDLISLFVQLANSAWCRSWKPGSMTFKWAERSSHSVNALGRVDVGQSKELRYLHGLPCNNENPDDTLENALLHLTSMLEGICLAGQSEELSMVLESEDESQEGSNLIKVAHECLDKTQPAMGTTFDRAIRRCLALAIRAKSEKEEVVWQELHEHVLTPLNNLWQQLEEVRML